MLKTGWWSMDIKIELDGEPVSLNELSDNSRTHILQCIQEGYECGALTEEVDDSEEELD